MDFKSKTNMELGDAHKVVLIKTRRKAKMSLVVITTLYDSRIVANAWINETDVREK